MLHEPPPTCPHCEGYNIHTDPYECIRAQNEQINDLRSMFGQLWLEVKQLKRPISAKERAQ